MFGSKDFFQEVYGVTESSRHSGRVRESRNPENTTNLDSRLRGNDESGRAVRRTT